MVFTVDQFAEVDVVRLPRRVMMAEAPSIRTDIRKMVERGRKNIVLDLSDVAFIDSSGWLVGTTAVRNAKSSCVGE